jgi:hypothetical protein
MLATQRERLLSRIEWLRRKSDNWQRQVGAGGEDKSGLCQHAFLKNYRMKENIYQVISNAEPMFQYSDPHIYCRVKHTEFCLKRLQLELVKTFFGHPPTPGPVSVRTEWHISKFNTTCGNFLTRGSTTGSLKESAPMTLWRNSYILKYRVWHANFLFIWVYSYKKEVSLPHLYNWITCIILSTVYVRLWILPLSSGM